MDVSTFLGMIITFGLIVFGIISGKTGVSLDKMINFFDPASIYITVGGTFAILISCYPFSTLLKIPSHFAILLGLKKNNPIIWIDKIAEYALMARKNGLLVLEEKANEETDPFFKSGIMLIVDAVDADKARARLESDIMCLNDRHEESVGFYEKGAAIGPAMGMIGTLVGLVNMLKGMDMSGSGGGSTIGQDMSVALITTFYGSVLANVIFTPIANKLKVRNQEELLCKQIILEGVLSIQAGENPKYIKEKLLAYLPQKERDKKEKADENAPKGDQ